MKHLLLLSVVFSVPAAMYVCLVPEPEKSDELWRAHKLDREMAAVVEYRAAFDELFLDVENRLSLKEAVSRAESMAQGIRPGYLMFYGFTKKRSQRENLAHVFILHAEMLGKRQLAERLREESMVLDREWLADAV